MEILKLSKRCCTIARELHAEIKNLKLDNGGYRRFLSKAAQSIRKSRWLKETQAKLDSHTRTLDTLILIGLDTRSLRRSHDLDTLDRNVRDLALRLERGVNTTARLLADQTSQILDHFDQRFDDREREREIDQDRERFKASLFFPDIEAREDEIVEAFEGTCKWIFDPPIDKENNAPKWHNFRQWLEAGKAVYWISGKPGSGKSTLMKYIVTELRTARYLSERERDTELIIVTFFFKDLGTELQKSVTGLLRSIIWQITRYWPGMIDPVLRRYGQSTGQLHSSSILTLLPTWTDRRLLQILKDFIKEKPAAVSLCAFIDGLDEHNGDKEPLFEVIHLLSSASGCKVCVSSRPDQAFPREFQGYPQCQVQDLNKKDIERMAIEKLKPCLEKNKPTETEAINKLVKELIEKAEGVFLWTGIMIKDLKRGSNNGDSIDELRDRLRVTPSTVYGLYRRILGVLDKSYLGYALKTFQILIAAELLGGRESEWLTFLSLACVEDTTWVHVTRFDRSYFSSSTFDSTCRELRTRLNARCGNLIEIENNEDKFDETIVLQHSRAVDFIHRTAVEFLKEEYESTFSEDSCLSAAWVPLARACIGSIFLFPLTQRPNEDYKLRAGKDGCGPDGENPSGCALGLWDGLDYKLSMLVAGGMRAISFGENSARNAYSRRPHGNVQSELTAQILQTLHHMATTDEAFKTFDRKHYCSMKWILEKVERSVVGFDNMEAQPPFQDHMRFAAFWGCESYIRSRFSPNIPVEQLEAIFASAVLGMRPNRFNRFDRWHRTAFPVSQLLEIVDILLRQGKIPRGKTDIWRPYGYLMRASPWGSFFLHACEALREVKKIGSDLYSKTAAWTQQVLELIEIFLSLGADHNTRISFRIDVYPRQNYDAGMTHSFLLVDWTPLACIQWHALQEMEGISEIETILQSRGAVNQTRYRFFGQRNIYYRIDTSHAKDLESLLLSTRYHVEDKPYSRAYLLELNVDVNDELFRVFEGIVSANSPLDWATVDKEWAHGGSNWPEYYHKPETQPQQELQLSRRHSL
ncbi:MAG: hypothetical protein Q9199_005772 [Rusavskia elegans]